MPLTARLRDEENERINNILNKLVALDYVPENGDESINAILKDLALDMQSLLNMSAADLIAQLQKLHFDWANAEQFADFLTTLSAKLPQEKFALKQKAVSVYDYIQGQSKTFSFAVFHKISANKKK